MKYSLKELRARKDMTQKEMAEYLGISPQTYCDWEKNPGMIKLSKLIEIGKCFEINISEIKN